MASRVTAGQGPDLIEVGAAARLAAIVESTQDAILATDLAGDVTGWSPAAERLFGHREEDIVGRSVCELIPDDRLAECDQILESIKQGQSINGFVTERVHRDGHVLDVTLTVTPIREPERGVVGASAIVRDLTALRAAERASVQAQRDIEAQHRVLEQIASGEPLADVLDSICSEVEARYAGARCSVLMVGPHGSSLRHVAGPSLPVEYQRAIDGLAIADGSGVCGTAAARREPVIVPDVQLDPLTERWRELLHTHGLRALWSHPVVDRTGEVLGTFAVYRSEPHTPDALEQLIVAGAGRLAALAIERHRAEEALAAASLVDPLTGLPNRRQFLELLTACLERPASSASSVAVLFLDLDRFKSVNDSLGHPAGDRLLVEAARRLGSVLRGDDVLSRFGGDEFTVLIRDADTRGLATVAERMLATFAEPFVLDGREFFMSVSIGIACGTDGAGPHDLIRDADVAMYEAKGQGPGRYVVFGEQLRNRALERVTLETELRRALERGELRVHYQPIFDLSERACVGAEALVRWQHPSRGLLPPDAFIGIAEESGLLTQLGNVVLDEVLAQIRRWDELGLAVPVHVNVSPLQLSDPGLVAHVTDALARHAVGPGKLFVEITETAVMAQLHTARAALEALTAAGVGVLIDDFGTGYSSIARLSDLPVMGLKIDRRFTAALGVDPSIAKVTLAIIDLAQALELQVVAEGIETQAALDALIAFECTYGQGFHLGRPAGPEAITALF